MSPHRQSLFLLNDCKATQRPAALLPHVCPLRVGVLKVPGGLLAAAVLGEADLQEEGWYGAPKKATDRAARPQTSWCGLMLCLQLNWTPNHCSGLGERCGEALTAAV
ncbi:hypothetical protein MHYP_G00207030 [Metynnis hypsauchen]